MVNVKYKVISQKPFVVDYILPYKVTQVEYPEELSNGEFLKEFNRIKEKYNPKSNSNEKT